MENKEIEKNIKLFIKFLNNPNLSTLNAEEKRAILEVNNLCKTDPEFNEMVNKLKGSFSDESRMNILNDYLDQKELKEAKTNEEVISKTFGVDINDIEHKYLNSGKEIFSFYDPKIGRKRLLENPSDGTLVEFLKEEQNNNEDFQSNDYKANSTAILNEKLKEKNIELKMVYIGDLNDHQKEIDNLEEKKKKCLDEILKNKEKLGVVYVNLEDIVALDKDGKIIEGAFNEEKQKAEVQSPKEANYRAQEISNENSNVSSNENNGESYATDNTNVNEFNEFEDIPDIISAEGIDPAMREEVAANLKKYYKNPDAMLALAPLEREYYEKLVGILSEKIELKKENKQVMTLKNPDNKWGFSNIVLLSIIAIALAIVVLIMIF
ncbi:unknown [Clostridium sp. CAG:433]|nr:unknown [Clostridium sp. CAG:433]